MQRSIVIPSKGALELKLLAVQYLAWYKIGKPLDQSLAASLLVGNVVIGPGREPLPKALSFAETGQSGVSG